MLLRQCIWFFVLVETWGFDGHISTTAANDDFVQEVTSWWKNLMK